MKAILKNRGVFVIVMTVFLLGICALGTYIVDWELRPQLFEIYFFQLNKGRSIFMRTPHNQTILIDGGQNTQVLRELTKVFPFYRRRIDTLILTSSLPKDSGGLAEVVQRFSVGKIIEPIIMGTSTALDAFEKAVSEKSLEIQKIKKGDMLTIDGTEFNVLFPDPDFSFTKTNLPEMVLKISYASTTIVLLGDASKALQKSFVSEIGETDIVEYANSASNSLASPDLFQEMNPKYAVISKQIRSAPSKPPKVPPFDIQKQKGTTVLNLTQKGTVHFVSDGKTLELK